MSRLNFAPKLDDIKITEIKQGLGEFAPRPDKAASFEALRETLKKAGYTLASADITLSGTLVREGDKWAVEANPSKQRFYLAGPDVDKLLQGIDVGSAIEVQGDWQTDINAGARREVVRIVSAKRTTDKNGGAVGGENKRDAVSVKDIQMSLGGASNSPGPTPSSIRTTNPGLTVFKGGAIIPRYFYTRRHLGNLKINSQVGSIEFSYTPTSTLQLAAEIPFQHVSFKDGSVSSSGSGFGNITIWGKYRFYRELETWGDKQAAIRFGLELPTGEKDAPGKAGALDEYVTQQLSPINGGVALHSDLSYSKARRRFIYGGDIEATLRGARDGFRRGHEIRVNTDLEYVLLPRNYQSPGHELFVSLETSYNYRHRGQLGGRPVPGSGGSEFYVAPGLQFTATPRLVIESSFQVIAARNLGPLALRNDKSVLVGIRYLY